MRRIDPRVQDLHGVTAAIGKRTQLPGEKRGRAAATYRHAGPRRRKQFTLCGAKCEWAA